MSKKLKCFLRVLLARIKSPTQTNQSNSPLLSMMLCSLSFPLFGPFLKFIDIGKVGITFAVSLEHKDIMRTAYSCGPGRRKMG